MSIKENSSKIKSLTTLVSGNVLAQIIPFLLSPVLSRIYLPSEHASYGVFTSLVSIFGVTCFFRYEQSILVAEDRHEANTNLWYSLLILSLFTSFVLLLIILIPKSLLEKWFSLGVIIWLLPIEVLLYGLHLAFENYRIRLGEYKRVAASKISKSFGQIGGQIVLGLAGLRTGFGSSLGYSIGTLSSLPSLCTIKRSNTNCSKGGFRRFLKTYKRFPLLFFPGSLVNMLAINLTTLFLNELYDASLVGYYSFSTKYLGLPIVFIGEAIQKVYIKYAKEEQQETGGTKKTYLFVIKLLSLFIPFFVLFFFVAPICFKFVFGDPWEPAGYVAKILIPLYAINLLYSPISGICILKRKERTFLLLQIMLLISSLIPFIVNAIIGIEFMVYLKIYSGMMCLVYSGMLAYSSFLNLKGERMENE